MRRNLTTAKKNDQNEPRFTAKPLLGKLIKWTTWTILAVYLVVLILYIAGSYQKAPDDSQLALVRMCLVLSLLLIISSSYGFVLNLFYTAKRRHISCLIGAAGYIALIALGAILTLSAAFIIGAVGGNR